MRQHKFNTAAIPLVLGLAGCTGDLTELDGDRLDGALIAEEAVDDGEGVHGVDVGANGANHAEDLDIAGHGDRPLELTKTCEGDNDWAGGTSCFNSAQHTGWTFASSTAWKYFYDDVRYTTSSSASGSYHWTAPVSGTAKFYVWIPSNKATADVEYEYYCATGSGTYSESIKIVNQNLYYGEWVQLGSKTSKAGFVCGITVQKANGATASEIMAMDGVKLVFTY